MFSKLRKWNSSGSTKATTNSGHCLDECLKRGRQSLGMCFSSIKRKALKRFDGQNVNERPGSSEFGGSWQSSITWWKSVFVSSPNVAPEY